MLSKKKKGWLSSIILLVILGAVAWTYHYYFEKYDYPTFKKLQSVQFEAVSLRPDLTLGFKAEAVFHNPSPIKVNITELYCEVFVDGKKTTTVQQKIKRHMPAHADFSIPLQFDLPLGKGNLLKDLGQILGGAWKKKSIQIRAIGTISISIAQLSMDIPFEQEEVYKLEEYFN
ncbi:MAG: hypothetical protein AAF985_13255 [Bacteroidota bacterium]